MRFLRNIVVLVGATLLVANCAPKTGGAPAEPHPEIQAWADQVDWTAARDEAAQVLADYMALDTSNPPGNEVIGVAYLADLLGREGFEVERHAFAPGRENLVARLRSDAPTEAPLCLLSHVDVATAEAEHWAVDPFGGVIDDDGYIWGRGAIDMKSVGVIEMMSAVWLKRLGVPLRRDVVILAVGDEEVDNNGVKFLAEHHWDDIGCSHLLNEGGFGIRGGLVDDLTTFAISFTEKGALWIKMWAEGEPGHGSTPLPDAAPKRLMAALEAIQGRKVTADYHPELFKLLRSIGQHTGGVKGAVLRSPTLTRSLATPLLMDHPLSRAILTNTVNVTGFGGAEEPNVLPSKVWAQIDIRMLPGVTSEDMLGELKALTSHVEGISFEVIQDLPAVESPTDDPFYQSIERQIARAHPDAAVGPFIMMGTTDSQILRPLGVNCYGMAPFVFDQMELRGAHGHDERIHVDNLGRGLQVLMRIVLDAAAREGIGPDAVAGEDDTNL